MRSIVICYWLVVSCSAFVFGQANVGNIRDAKIGTIRKYSQDSTHVRLVDSLHEAHLVTYDHATFKSVGAMLDHLEAGSAYSDSTRASHISDSAKTLHASNIQGAVSPTNGGFGLDLNSSSGLPSLHTGGWNFSSIINGGVARGGANNTVSFVTGNSGEILRIPSGDSLPTFGKLDLSSSTSVMNTLDTTHTAAKVKRIFGGAGVSISPPSGLGDVTITAVAGDSTGKSFISDSTKKVAAGNIIGTLGKSQLPSQVAYEDEGNVYTQAQRLSNTNSLVLSNGGDFYHNAIAVYDSTVYVSTNSNSSGVGGTTRLKINATGLTTTSLTPFSTGLYDIGTSSLRFRNGYFDTITGFQVGRIPRVFETDGSPSISNVDSLGFNSTNFTVTNPSGARAVVNTKQDISTTSSPAFQGITIYTPGEANGGTFTNTGDGELTLNSSLLLNSGFLNLINPGAYKLLYTDGNKDVFGVSHVAAGQLLTSNGTTSPPVWSASPTLSTSLTTPVLYGSSASSGNLTLYSTSHSTKGDIILGETNWGGDTYVHVRSGATNNHVMSLRYNSTYHTDYSEKEVLIYNNHYQIQTATAHNLYFQTNGGNTRMTITSAGNVGIGDTSPGSLFQVTGADNTTIATIKVNTSQANVTASDVYLDFRSTSGSEGTIAGTAVAGVIAYNTFTGAHYAQLQNEAEQLEIGMLVSATGQLMEGAKQLPLITKTMGRGDKKVYGVFAGKIADAAAQSEVDSFLTYRKKNEKPARAKEKNTKNFDDSLRTVEETNWNERIKKKSLNFGKGSPRKDMYQVFAVGTGVILVTNTGGDIAIGDLLWSSPVAGLGEKQDDDIVRNATIAKATERVEWSDVVAGRDGVKRKLIACVYK